MPSGGDAVRALQADGAPASIVTITTPRARGRLADDLRGLGIELDSDELTTTPVAARQAARGARARPDDAGGAEDLARRVDLVEATPKSCCWAAPAGPTSSGGSSPYENLNRAFLALEARARLIYLLQRPLVADLARALLDSGAFVAGLEYAAGVEAEVVGKPARAYFGAFLADGRSSRGRHGRRRRRGGHRRRAGQRRASRARPSSAPTSSGERSPGRRRSAAGRGPVASIADVPAFTPEADEGSRPRPDRDPAGPGPFDRYPRSMSGVSARRSGAYCDSQANPAQHYAARSPGRRGQEGPRLRSRQGVCLEGRRDRGAPKLARYGCPAGGEVGRRESAPVRSTSR